MIKVAINNDYLLKDYTEESFPHSMIIEYNYQEIMLDEKYKDCVHEDFDLVSNQYQFNPVKYTARTAKEKEKKYNMRISSLIHEKYSLDDEIALINNKETRPAEYQEYQRYRERCKERARSEGAM